MSFPSNKPGNPSADEKRQLNGGGDGKDG